MSQLQEIIPGFGITIFKAIMESTSVGALNDMSEKTEVITESKKGILVNP